MQNFLLNELAIFSAAVAIMAVVFAVYWRRTVQAANGNIATRVSKGQLVSAVLVSGAILALLMRTVIVMVCGGVNFVSIIRGW